MPKFKKGEGGYWLGKTFEKRAHSRHTYNCLVCGNEFWRSDYARQKGLENPKMMPKFCSRKCQMTNNKNKLGKPGSHTSFKKGDARIIGAANTNWRGGITPVAEAIRRLSHYKEWRKAVYERDGYTCVLCGQGGRLNADHSPVMFHKILENYNIKSVKDALACSILWDVSNGQTLCLPCHQKKTSGELGHVYKSEARMKGMRLANQQPVRKITPRNKCGYKNVFQDKETGRHILIVLQYIHA